MDINSLSAKEAEVRDLLYRPGCTLMSVGRPGPEAFKGCNEILVAATKGLLVREDMGRYTLLKRQTVMLGYVWGIILSVCPNNFTKPEELMIFRD